MKYGKLIFERHLAKIEQMTITSNEYDNPALWLYYYDVRTPLFMLEGLSRLYSHSHNPKFFNKLKKEIKRFEDHLGEIDFYDNLCEEFRTNKKLPKEIFSHFEEKLASKIKELNKYLVKEKWLNGKKVKSIRAKLEELKWQEEKQDIKSIKSTYKEQATHLHEVISDPKFMMNDIEFDVHEYRRKIRWMSIYPNALNGAVKLITEKPVNEKLNSFLTPEVLSSPYVKIRAAKELIYHIELSKINFLALSWAISELGDLKDTGLKIEILVNTYMKVNKLEEKEALLQVYTLLGKQYPHMDDILRKATLVTYKLASNKVLLNLFH